MLLNRLLFSSCLLLVLTSALCTQLQVDNQWSFHSVSENVCLLNHDGFKKSADTDEDNNFFLAQPPYPLATHIYSSSLQLAIQAKPESRHTSPTAIRAPPTV